MGQEMITFGDTEMEKRKFNPYKDLIFSNNVNIDNIFNMLHKKMKNIMIYWLPK